MKRFIVFVAVLMLVPMAAFGMEELADDVMGDITGQAGVTITFGGETSVTATSTGVAWGDPDGDGTGNAAHMRIDGNMITETTVAAGSSMTIDLADGTGVIIGLGGMDVDVTMQAAELTIGAGAGSTPDWTGGPDAVLGVLSLNQTTVDLALPSALVIRPH
jgi:hypothetical protein